MTVKVRVSSPAVPRANSDGLRASCECPCSTLHGTCTRAAGMLKTHAYVVGLNGGVGGSGDVVYVSIACLVRSGDGR